MSDTGRRIVKASLAVMVAHLIFKFAGLIQAKVIGHYCDDVTRDLFVFGFETVLTTIYLVGEEGLGPAFLPVFMEELDRRDGRAAWRFSGTVLALQLLCILVAIGVVFGGAETVVRVCTDWDAPEAPAAYMERAPFYARWMVLGLLGLSLGSTTYLILNGYKRFFLAAFGDATVKFVLVAAIFLGVTLGHPLAYWLCAGVVAGSLAKVLTHAVGLRRELHLLRLNLDLRSPSFRRFMLLVLPLLVGILFAKVRDVYNDTWVLSATGEMGLVSINSWGKKIFRTFGWLVPYAGSIAMYPFFCELVDREDREELARLVSLGCRIILVLCVPLTAGVVALSLPLTQLIYQGGQFDLADCRLAAVANAGYTLVLPFFALEYVFMQAYFSNRRMWTPILLGLLFSALSMVLSYAGVVHFEARGQWALAAVAGAFVISRSGKVISLALLMRRFLPTLDGFAALAFAARLAVAGLFCGTMAYGGRWLLEDALAHGAVGFEANSRLALVAVLAAGAGAGGVAYLVALRVFCRAEWQQTLAWARARLRQGHPAAE